MKITVHPAAEAFRMMTGDELAELAADIKANGLLHPIILDHTGEWLVDGRNRLKACEIAEVAPRFEHLNGQDPRAYVVSANIARRNITKGQQALAMAFIYPEPEKGGRGKTTITNSKETLGFSPMRLSQARQIIRHPDLVDMVKSGAMPFDSALTEARERAIVEQSTDEHIRILEVEAPDLAQQVTEEHLKITEAWAAFQQRKLDDALAEKNKQETLLRTAEALYRGAAAFAVSSFVDAVRERLRDVKFRAALLDRLRIDGAPDDIRAGAAALADILGEINGS